MDEKNEGSADVWKAAEDGYYLFTFNEALDKCKNTRLKSQMDFG